ncbi:alpha/beta hydrolase [Nocardia sp. CA2R105]|uniref:alpha/beta hydrolase n=1 Tax=Nocardia coffeae TaxID=2873381 RepID=UPI001CA73A86|nr:alpha/beta hydrolase [Nocardia coffeae]MBY8859292.1 alpha/beta hydrolase [Nocardia coffeae]
MHIAGAPVDIPEEMISTVIRPEFAALAPVEVFPGVVSHLDRAYATLAGFRPLTLDLHIPHRPVTTPVPVVVYAHPGGFFAGIKQMGPWRYLLEAGLAVVSVQYRLSGEAVFPAAIHDVAAAVRWVRANADNYGLDADRIVGFGSSAGAYLISAVALAGDGSDLVGSTEPDSAVSCGLAAVVEHYGPTDFLRHDEDAHDDAIELMTGPDSTLARFFGFEPASRPDAVERGNLCRLAHPGAPPFLIAHGDHDRRVGIAQSRRLHRALTEAGVRADLVEIAGGDHGSPHFNAPPLHQRTLAFLESVLALPLHR